MEQTVKIILNTWLENADEALHASGIVEVQFIMERKHGGHISMFLLHYAIELYLKAFLMGKSATFKHSHDLEYLFQECVKIDPQMDYIWYEQKDTARKMIYWIKWINPFNKEDGGIRYLNTKRTMWAYPLGIQDYFSPMIGYIKSQVDENKDITEYCIPKHKKK